MSSCPGFTLEAYVAWQHDVVVPENDDDPNPSLRFAEVLGTIPPRPRLTRVQFAAVIAPYEPYREQIEDKLLEYDEDENGSWRTYAGYSFDFVPEAVWQQAHAALPSRAAP